jgi:hypothetical protein
MGAGIVLIFWIILLGILGSCWLICLCVYRRGKKSGNKVIRWIGLIPLGGVSLLFVALSTLIFLNVVRLSVPRFVYADALGHKPTADVAGLKSKAWSFADTTVIFLQFKVSSNTLPQIVPKGLERVAPSEFMNRFHSSALDSPPKWWVPITGAPGEYFMHISIGGEGKRHSSEWRFMTYDPSSGIGQYFYIGID